VRCAPSSVGLAKPTTPTNKKTTPKILQTVFAICDPLLCQTVVNQRQPYPVRRGIPPSTSVVVRLVRRMYTRDRAAWQSFLQGRGDILFAKLFNQRGA